MNYTELVAEIQSYVENQFTTTDINTFIQQAEQRVYNTVQLPAFRKNVTGTLTIGNSYLSVPTDWLATFSLAVITAAGEYQYLLNKDVNFIRQAYPNPNEDKAIPKYYALFGPRSDNPAELTFILGPTPDAAYGAELHYFFYPPSITVAPYTSWLGDNFDPVLLYASLVEAYTFMKGEADMMTLYNQKFMEALALAKRLGDGLERQDAYRSGQFRQAVT